MAVMEEQLYAGKEGADGGGAVYPAALVALTSALGFAAARRLAAAGAIGSLASWALQCIAVAKLSMLLLPEVRLTRSLNDPLQQNYCLLNGPQPWNTPYAVR